MVFPRSLFFTSLLGAGVFVGLAGCSGPAVHYDFDAKTAFSAYHTYDWRPAPRGLAGRAGGFDNAIMNGRVQRAVEAQLSAQGFARDTSGSPDFLVVYYPSREPGRSHQAHLGLGFGMGPVGLGVGAPVGDPHREAVAAMVLEVQDGRTRSVVWKATAEGALQGSDSPSEADANVAAAVRNMLKRFPPK